MNKEELKPLAESIKEINYYKDKVSEIVNDILSFIEYRARTYKDTPTDDCGKLLLDISKEIEKKYEPN